MCRSTICRSTGPCGCTITTLPCNAPTGWHWAALVGKGDYLNFVGIAMLSGLTILCYLVILPILFRKKDTAYVVIAIVEVLVLVARGKRTFESRRALIEQEQYLKMIIGRAAEKPPFLFDIVHNRCYDVFKSMNLSNNVCHG